MRFFLLFCFPLFLQATPLPYQVHLVSSLNQVQKGQTFLIGIQFNLKKRWHTYWSYPGDVGRPLEAEWTLPQGIKVDSLKWPLPERLTYTLQKRPIHSFAYKKEVLIPVQITVGKNYSQNEIPIELKLNWFVCEEICFMETDQLFLNLKVGNNYSINKTYYPLFQKWESKLPQPLLFQTYFKGESLKTTLHFYFDEPIECLDLLPQSEQDFKTHPPQKVKQTNQSCLFEVFRPSSYSSSLKGLLVYKKQGKRASSLFTSHEKDSLALFWFILFAFLGGLILNIMPCVLPIIFLKFYKTLDLIQKNPKTILRANISYGSGVISSFLILAFIIFISKSSGEAMGWGFHMQSPLFVSLLALLFLFMGLYLLHLLPLPLPKTKLNLSANSVSGHFFTGVLSTLSASPCTVPFMAPAVGFAFSRSYFEVFSIFFFLGLGLSFPYFIFTFSPRLFKYIPRPKNWMETFKSILSIPLFLVTLWLFYVLSFQITLSSFLITLLVFPLFLVMVLSFLYLKQKILRNAAVAICLILIGTTLSFQQTKHLSTQKVSPSVYKNFKPFSLKTISNLKKENKNIFVYVGAEWCLTCKWNEVFFKNKEVMAFFKKHRVELLYGDWTYRKSEITNFLESYQRRGVPFYLFYRGDTQIATVLNSAFFSASSFLKELNTPFEKDDSSKE